MLILMFLIEPKINKGAESLMESALNFCAYKKFFRIAIIDLLFSTFIGQQ